jgi:carboxylesterase
MMKDYSFIYPGNQRGILLIHGLTGTPSEMRFIGKALNKRGFMVSCPTLAGHCQTEIELLKTKWQHWYASVEHAYHQLRAQVQEVYVAGLSMGALLTLHLAAKYPLQGIALYSTTLTYDGWSIPLTRILLPLLPLVVKIPLLRKGAFIESHPYGIKDEKIRRKIVEQMYSGKGALPSTPYPALLELKRLITTVKRDLPQIKTPTLIIHARHDDMCSVHNAHYISRHIGAPHTLHFLDNSYHLITVDQERDKVSQLTADFFQTLATSHA